MRTPWFFTLLLTTPLGCLAQTAVFTDNFSHGSTLNGLSSPGGTPAASFTSYDIASTVPAVSGPALASGNLRLTFDAPTTSGLLEAQARFTATPVVLATVGDYIGLTVVFTDTGGSLLTGGDNSYLYDGLYSSGGSAPAAGALNNGGLSATPGSPYATGHAANWSGYAGRFAAAFGGFQITQRQIQNGPGTTSANQDLVGNNVISGAFSNPAGTAGFNGASMFSLTSGSQYTMYLKLTLSAPGTIGINNSLFSGTSIAGLLITNIYSPNWNGADYFNSFDGLAVGVLNRGTSLNPTMEISSISVTDYIQAVPEPAVPALLAVGAGLLAVYQWRRNRRYRGCNTI